MKSFVFPGNIEPEILAIAAEQVPYMRTEWFSELVIGSENMLLDLINCPTGKVIPYTASGTAAMDACVMSFVSTCKKALVINGGTFGARWGQLCSYYGISHDEFLVEFGRDPDWDALMEKIKSGEYDVVLMQHHETSSGYLYNLDRISVLCKDYGLYLVVDAISSFLSDPLSMKDQGVDIALLSSQKGLNLPPGLSFIVLSESVTSRGQFAKSSFYYDWNEQLLNLKRGQTPYSPATHLFMQLHARLCKIKEYGIVSVLNDVKEKAESFREACLANGWQFSANRMSNCLTGIYLPFLARPLVNALIQKDIYIMPCRHENMIRVAHLGASTIPDHLKLIEEIEKWQKMTQK